MYQRADHIANHVLQKGTGTEFKDDHFTDTPDFGVVHGLDGGFGLAFGGTKGREVMFAPQGGDGGLHRFNGERAIVPADASML